MPRSWGGSDQNMNQTCSRLVLVNQVITTGISVNVKSGNKHFININKTVFSSPSKQPYYRNKQWSEMFDRFPDPGNLVIFNLNFVFNNRRKLVLQFRMLIYRVGCGGRWNLHLEGKIERRNAKWRPPLPANIQIPKFTTNYMILLHYLRTIR